MFCYPNFHICFILPLINYSMKHQKSSYSLHSTASSLLLKERSPNLYHRSPASIYGKKAPSYSTSFANIHNARGKLNSCSLQMAELQKSSQQVSLANKDIRLEVNFLTDRYKDHRMKEAETELLKQVKALQKTVTIRKRSDMLKYDSFQQIFNSMHKGHKDTRKAVEELERRVSQLEHVMGVDNPMTIGDITPA